MSFFKTIKKLGESLGLDRLAKRMLGLSDDEYDEAADVIDNSTDTDIENKLGIDTSNPGYRIAKGAIQVGNWGKEQIEASTGAAANETNKEIAEKNLEFEREKFDYDKALQERLFEREDTANQRTVNDMRLAGLNPLNMQGTNGAGEVVSTQAPQNNFVANPQNNLQLIDTFFNSALQAKATQSNNSLQQANANLLNAQAENQRIKNLYESNILAGQVTGLRYDNTAKFINQQNMFNNYMFNKMMGWTDNTPDWLKMTGARMQTRFYDDGNTKNELLKGLGDPLTYWYLDKYNPMFAGNEQIRQDLLSDELLTGTMGIFGTLMKYLIGGN